MKKLLSLLSVLTISGTAIPTTIAASSYQKEKNKLESNLETLNRNKRQAKPLKPYTRTSKSNRKILMGYFPRIEINTTSNDRWVIIRNNNFASIQNAIRILAQNNIILTINNLDGRTYYVINQKNRDNEYFVLSFLINGRNFDIVIRTTDFYVQDFITSENNNTRQIYRHFPIVNNNVTITNLENVPQNYQGYEKINNVRSSNYNNLVGNNNSRINWDEVLYSFNRVSSWNNPQGIDFAIIILAMSESICFTEMGGMLQCTNVYSENNPNYTHEVNPVIYHWNNFLDLITNWGRLNENFLNIESDEIMVFLIFRVTAARLINQCQNNNRFPRDTTLSQNICYEYFPLTFYFKKDKNDKIIYTYHRSEVAYWTQWNFNLKNINPLSFNKIEILLKDNVYTKIILGNNNNYTYEKNPGIKINYFFKDKYIKDIIENVKVDNNESDINKHSTHELINWKPYNLVSYQKKELTFYWENGNYYLQLLIFQYAKNYTFLFPKGDGLWLGIGKEIKLYNI